MRVKKARLWGLVAGLVGAAALMAPTSALALSVTPDNTWGTSGKVYALAHTGNTMFVGGTFKKLFSQDGTQKFSKLQNLAAVDMTTGLPIETFTPDVERSDGTPTVRALAVSPDGSTLYVGGRFDSINGVAVNNFAAISTDTGAVNVDASFHPRVNKAVEAIVVGPDKVYVGGSFKQVNGQDRLRLAAFAFDGTLTSWAPSANAVVRSLAMAPDGNSMFVGGLFTTVDGRSRQSVARVDLVDGAINDWAIPFGVINNPQTAWAIVPRGGRVYIGFGHGPNYLAAFHLDTGTTGSQLWRINTVGNVESLALNTAGTTLFAGGHFGTASLQQQVCGNQWLRGLMAVDPATGAISCTWLPQLEPHGANFTGAWCMTITDTQLWVGGLFTSVSGVTAHDLARFTL
jgi:hypothetical protein